LLNSGSNWIDNNQQVQIKLGNQLIPNNEKQQTNIGYIKQRFLVNIMQKWAIFTVSVNSIYQFSTQQSSPSYGAIYWQYFEDLDQITTSATSPLSLKKNYLLKELLLQEKHLNPLTKMMNLKWAIKLLYVLN
jgi:hypothetical protein